MSELEKRQIDRTLELIKNTNEMIKLQYEVEEGEIVDEYAVRDYEQIKRELLKDLKQQLQPYSIAIEDIFNKDDKS